MATWNSRGLRGSTLEEMINRTNEKYREDGLALIQKRFLMARKYARNASIRC